MFNSQKLNQLESIVSYTLPEKVLLQLYQIHLAEEWYWNLVSRKKIWLSQEELLNPCMAFSFTDVFLLQADKNVINYTTLAFKVSKLNVLRCFLCRTLHTVGQKSTWQPLNAQVIPLKRWGTSVIFISRLQLQEAECKIIIKKPHYIIMD